MSNYNIEKLKSNAKHLGALLCTAVISLSAGGIYINTSKKAQASSSQSKWNLRKKGKK